MPKRHLHQCVVALLGCVVAGYGATQADEFYAALRADDLSHLETLLKQGANPNLADERGLTPLMYAATVGSPAGMRILIEKGADVNAKNAFGSTALMWSATDIQKTRLLLEHGADPNLSSKAGRTALLIAAM